MANESVTSTTMPEYMTGRDTTIVNTSDIILVNDPGSPSANTITIGDLIQATVDSITEVDTVCDLVGGLAAHQIAVNIYVEEGSVKMTVGYNPEGPIYVQLADESRLFTPQEIILTAGTDFVPQSNYVYLTYDSESEIVTVQANTTGWPTSVEHVRIVYVSLKSVSTIQSNPLSGIVSLVQSPDYICNTSSLLSVIVAALSKRHAGFVQGGELSLLGSGTSSITFSIAETSMVSVRQLTVGAFPNPAPFFCANHPTNQWGQYTALSNLTVTQSGSPIVNNQIAVFVIGVAAADDGASPHLWVSVPTAYYTSESNAQADVSGYAVTRIPEEYRGVGCLLWRVAMKFNSVPVTEWEVISTTDLRGTLPGTAVAGSTVSSVFSDALFALFDDVLPARKLRISLSGIDGEVTLNINTLSTLNPANVVVQVPVPVSTGSPGTTSNISWDNTNVYFKTPVGWKKAILQDM